MLVSEIMRKTANQKKLDNSSSKTTPNVNKLLKKFSSLSNNIRKTSKQKNARIEQKLHQLQKDIEDYAKEDTENYLNSKLTSLTTYIEELKEENQKSQNQKSLKTKNTNNDFLAKIADLKQLSKELFGGFVKESEKHMFGVELAIKKSQKVFNEQMNHYELGINESIDFLEKEAEREMVERETRVIQIEEEVKGCLAGIEEDIGLEREMRETTEFKVRELIEQLDSELVERIVEEKRLREKSNNSLLNLLEQACCRLEKNFGSY